MIMKMYQSRCQICLLALTVMMKITLMMFYLPIKESWGDLGKFKRSCKILCAWLPSTRDQIAVMTEEQEVSFCIIREASVC